MVGSPYVIGQPTSRVQHWLKSSDQVYHFSPARTLLPLSKRVNTRLTTSVSCCFSTLWQLHSIRRQVSIPVFQSLVVTFDLSRLDYCKVCWLGCLSLDQSGQNAAAQLRFGLRRSEHNGRASQSLQARHPREHPLQSRRIYLPNREWQCSCVPAILLYPSCWRSIAIETPIYHPSPTNWLFHLTTSLVSAEGPFQFWLPFSGTVTLHISHQHRRSRFSGSVLRLFSSGAPMLT